MSDLFTAYERLETCRRVEVTVENLHILAQHFGGTAIYTIEETRHFQRSKPRFVIPESKTDRERTIEVGAWVDEKGIRWNPEPLTQGWFHEGTFTADGAPTATAPTPDCCDACQIEGAP